MRKYVFALLLLVCMSLPASAAKIYTEPYLLSLNPSSEMNVCWLLGEPGEEAWVEFGESEALGETARAELFEVKGIRTSATLEGYDDDPVKNPELAVYQRIATLTNLKPGAAYHYRVMTKSAGKVSEGKRYFFKTAPEAGKPFSFVLLSDLQQKKQILDTVGMAGRENADFIIYAGDFQNTPWKASEWFPVENCFTKPEEKGKEWFTAMQQTEGGARLLQYLPLFPCPGNHEADDQRIWTDKGMAVDPSKKTLSIYMQLFRPLYPEQEYQRNGKHWYSADYGDLHIVSLSIFRWHPWDGYEAPGWILFDDISPESPQVKWLEKDLEQKSSPLTWVVQHWHMLNRGAEVWIPMSEPLLSPVNPAMAVYPYGDHAWNVLRPLYEKHGVNAVNFGHSHVYERYLINGVNYIEAATIGNNYREENDPLHFSGNAPVVENNRHRSFMLVSVADGKMEGKGIRASADGNGSVQVGEVFDSFTMTR